MSDDTKEMICEETGLDMEIFNNTNNDGIALRSLIEEHRKNVAEREEEDFERMANEDDDDRPIRNKKLKNKEEIEEIEQYGEEDLEKLLAGEGEEEGDLISQEEVDSRMNLTI